MDGCKKSLPILFGLLIFSAVPASRVSPGPEAPERPRKFYLTETQYDGAHALSACARGYHMASLWEIWDPSNLRYNTDLGLKSDDSGLGPPSEEVGWIRTGSPAGVSGPPGKGNCNLWTEGDPIKAGGTVVWLSGSWNSADSVYPVSPWIPSFGGCIPRPVWCVQD